MDQPARRLDADVSAAAIIRLEEVGIMHTNVSEANMAVRRTENGQGMLAGFEFAILDKRLSKSKRTCPETLRTSEGKAGGESSSEMTPATEEPFGDAITPHVASLPLSRCSDHPPAHRFQHELESFIWSILFIQSGFRYGKRIVNPRLEGWYTGNWDSIRTAKHRFLTRGRALATAAGQFAESFGVDPRPLVACSRLLGDMLIGSEVLDVVRVLSALQKTRDAYAVNE